MESIMDWWFFASGVDKALVFGLLGLVAQRILKRVFVKLRKYTPERLSYWQRTELEVQRRGTAAMAEADRPSNLERAREASNMLRDRRERRRSTSAVTTEHEREIWRELHREGVGPTANLVIIYGITVRRQLMLRDVPIGDESGYEFVFFESPTGRTLARMPETSRTELREITNVAYRLSTEGRMSQAMRNVATPDPLVPPMAQGGRVSSGEFVYGAVSPQNLRKAAPRSSKSSRSRDTAIQLPVHGRVHSLQRWNSRRNKNAE